MSLHLLHNQLSQKAESRIVISNFLHGYVFPHHSLVLAFIESAEDDVAGRVSDGSVVPAWVIGCMSDLTGQDVCGIVVIRDMMFNILPIRANIPCDASSSASSLLLKRSSSRRCSSFSISSCCFHSLSCLSCIFLLSSLSTCISFSSHSKSMVEFSDAFLFRLRSDPGMASGIRPFASLSSGVWSGSTLSFCNGSTEAFSSPSPAFG